MFVPPDTTNGPCRRSIQWIVIAVGVLVGNGTPSIAWATCGDYLHRVDELHHADQPMTADALSFHEPLPIKACSGPSCRRAPPSPMERPQPEERSPTAERWCLWTTGVRAIADEWIGRRVEDALVSTEDHRLGLDRPPRMA